MQKPELCAGEVDDWGDLPRPPPLHEKTSGAEIHQSLLMPGLHQLGKAHIIVQSWAGISCFADICSGMEPLPPLHLHSRLIYLLILGYLSWNKHKRNAHHTHRDHRALQRFGITPCYQQRAVLSACNSHPGVSCSQLPHYGSSRATTALSQPTNLLSTCYHVMMVIDITL